MPLFEHISDRLRCSGLHTNVYPFSYDTVQLNYDGYRVSKPGEVYSPVEEMALIFFGDSKKIKERNLRRLGTRHEGVTIHATLRDTTGAVVRTIKPERIVDEVRKIVFGTVSLVEEEQEHPKEADFVATVSYFSKSRTYPDIVDITAGPSLKDKFKGWNYEDIVRGPHVVGFPGWLSPPAWGFVGIAQTDDAATLSQRRRQLEKERKVTISVDGTPHVFGLSDAGTFYRGTLLSDGNLSLRGTLMTTDDPITFERWVYGVHANERVPSALATYLADRHPEMK